jgi:hypothetical protein
MQLFERMIGPAVAAAGEGSRVVEPEQEQSSRASAFSLSSMKNYALAGAGAALLLGIVELIDIHFKLTPVFASLSERLIITAYFSLNLLSGALIGLLVWLAVNISSLMKRGIEQILSRLSMLNKLTRLGAGFAVACFWAVLLNQQPSINRYVIGLIREAEKIEPLAQTLLNHERATSYLILLGLFISCSFAWMLARASRYFKPWLRVCWLAALALVIGAAYYANTTVEPQLYEATLDASLFLLATHWRLP